MWLLSEKRHGEPFLRICVHRSHPIHPLLPVIAKLGRKETEELRKHKAESGREKMMSTLKGKWADRQKDQRRMS